MSELINCPFCDTKIEANILKCPVCGALFREPELPNIKFKELGPFVAIDILTLGFFSTFWFFINGKAVNSLVSKPKDGLKLNWLVLLLALNGGFYLFFFNNNPLWALICSALQVVIYIALTYRVLRIIQKYTLEIYDSKLETNPFYIIFFNIFYLIHFLDTYKARVEGNHVFFDWKSPQGIMLIILLLIIIFILRFYNEMYLFLN